MDLDGVHRDGPGDPQAVAEGKGLPPVWQAAMAMECAGNLATPRGPAKRSCDFCRHRKRKCDGTLRHCARAPPETKRLVKKRGRPPKRTSLDVEIPNPVSLPPRPKSAPPPCALLHHELWALLDRVDITHSFAEGETEEKGMDMEMGAVWEPRRSGDCPVPLW
ncbi:hypothetical protein HDU96_008514 [Phlyctochytrium bullatum]|nr:hypothetical protein HDU96_008514 [Phlyctochytrium bullatum]